ncbi:hypothetical protein, partial [Mycolicibacterium sp. CBMA 361]|uniref:hypothetical protein n=1 Tax=Mycolicibacterium sp. CBMA 361 TaxID=2606610 RepID=UPI00193E82B8
RWDKNSVGSPGITDCQISRQFFPEPKSDSIQFAEAIFGALLLATTAQISYPDTTTKDEQFELNQKVRLGRCFRITTQQE